MAELETKLYAPVNGLRVAGYSYEDIQGTQAVPINSPFRLGHLPEFSIVSINGQMGENPALLRDRLVQISPMHGRSFELRFGATRNVLWEDEFGNLFSALNTKGNNLEQPKALKHSVAPSGYIVYGMQDSDAMVRVLKGSRLLRSNHIDTETIVRVIEPQELPSKDKVVPLGQFKNDLVTQIWEENAEKDSSDDATGRPNLSRADLGDLSLALDKMTFYLTIRGLQVSERMWDLPGASSQEEFREIMQGIFNFVNRAEKTSRKRKGNEIPFPSFDAQDNEDIQNYFLVYLPIKIATNLAKIHNLGLIHQFPHSGNISAAGGFYDLDSLRGETLELGDAQIEEDDYEREVNYLLCGSRSPAGSDPGVIEVIKELADKGFIKKDVNYIRKFQNLFLHQYIKTRGWEQDILSHIETVSRLFDGFKDQADGGVIKYYTALITQDTGIDYFHPDHLELLTKTLPSNNPEVRQWQVNATVAQLRGQTPDSAEPKEAGEENTLNRVYEGIKRDLEEKHRHELEGIVSKHGQDAADWVTQLFINRELRDVSLLLTADKMKRIIQSDIKKEAVKQMGWEENIVDHIEEIWELFDHFGFTADNKIQAHYTELLAKQLGWDYTFDEEFEDTVEGYIEQAEKTLLAFFKESVDQVPAGGDLATTIKESYAETYTEKPEFTDDFWESYIRQRIGDHISVKRGEEYNQLREKYGDNVVNTVICMFIDREINRISSDILTDEMQNTIAELEKEMELETLAKYSDDPNLLMPS